MSTKTLRKRIALVAVSTLGFGLVSVMPASAATAVTLTAPGGTVTVVAGQVAAIPVSGAVAAQLATTETVIITPTLTTKPNGSSAAVAAATVANTTLPTGATGYVPTATGTGAITVTAGAGTPAAWTGALIIGNQSLTTDVPGTYTVTLAVTGTGATAAAAALVYTVIAVPSTTSGSAITATQTSASGIISAANVITVVRTTGAATDGQILGQFTASADYTTAPLATVFGGVNGTSGVVAVGVTAAAPTFTITRTTMAVGSYTMRFWVDANSNGAYEAAETSTTMTFAVAGALSTIGVTLSAPTRSFVTGHDTFTVTATVSDALGGASSAANLYVSETTSTGIVLATGAARRTNIVDGTALARVGTTNTYVGTFAVTSAGALLTKNLSYVTVSNAVDVTALTTKVGTATLTVVGFGALNAVATESALQATSAVGIGTVSATTGLKQTGSVVAGAAAGALTVDPAITSITFTGTAATTAAPGEAGKYVYASVTPAAGTTCVTPTGAYVLILADLSFTYTVAKTCIDAESYTVLFTSLGGATNASMVVTFTDSAPTWTVAPAAYTNIYGSTNTLTATLADQYGRPIASKAVVASVTGRNVSSTALTTNAAGQVTWTSTDASTSTLLLTDTVTFTYNYTNSLATNTPVVGTRVITYAATAVAVGSITLVEDNAGNSQAIDQAESTPGVPANVTTYTATLKTAAGAPVAAGVLVTFAGGADDLFFGSKVGVTTSAGQATVKVYRHKSGYASITATANGVSSLAAGDVKWVNVATDARYVSVSAAQSVVAGGVGTVTATVTDRWGNAIGSSNVAVTFFTSGNGRILTAAPAATNAYGQIQVQVTSNTAETGVMNVLAAVTTASQVTNLAGYVGTAVVAGVTAGDKDGKATTVTFTKDTSTSTADALLALATALGTRDQASATVDAAAEATDAANAATDAANAAAEAADAATAAAQDASDAVAALSAQVSEAIAGLKKQLVSLTNLVIKIQKKVKA